MKRYRTTLPPLDLLIFFEAAHRVGSFTGCAAELHVSQAAVSKRIHQLEKWIGEPLFIRNGKRLASTESGERLYHTVGMALEFLRQGLGTLREHAMRPLSIGAHTVVGMFWLTAQLQAFGLSGDACPTRLVTSDNTGDLLAAKNDLLVIYSDGVVPGCRTTRLLDEEMVPMASPALAATLGADGNGSFQQYRRSDGPPLLNYLRSAPDWVDWRVWFDGLSLKGLEDWPLVTMSTYSQTIGEAIRGNGVALGSVALLQSELAAGRLVPLAKDVLRTDRGYYLCHSKNAPLAGEAQRLAAFLVTAAHVQNAASTIG
ncbi:LysR family transcriptional regulator [Mesorhizobium loti]|uniref:LysR family transcriptional regulator n=1 Tax=Mesorhizobium loti R88b TaxID=935548 RepID=A0A6M7WL11_RHILI|nr:LysR family transcriptional regulator [Mesorhizobium loti]QKD01533.1 LysR family transcriptional regulator [Mesorhizobium loti R88b]